MLNGKSLKLAKDKFESEEMLIASLKNGDSEAFEWLVKCFQRNVYNVCLSFLRNEQDADDISQEVFVALFEQISSFRMDASLSTWIYRVAVNKSLEELRKRKTKKRWSQLISIFGGENEVSDVSDFVHPGVLLENRERAQILSNHLEKLPDNQKTVFTLHKMEGLSYQEIANIMKLSLSSVESLMFRARNNLKKSLSHYYHSEQ